MKFFNNLIKKKYTNKLEINNDLPKKWFQTLTLLKENNNKY